MNATTAISVLTVLAAIPAVGFLALYARMPWWKSLPGRAVMMMIIGMTMLIGMGVLRVFFGTAYGWRQALLLTVYASLDLGLWAMFIALLRVRRTPPLDPPA